MGRPFKYHTEEERYEAAKQQVRNWNKNNPDKKKAQAKNSILKTNYGITLEDYNIMLFQQDGCCAICETHHTELKRKLAVDHNHITGEVRGLLCVNCNLAIGNLKDDITLLKKAIKYLKK